MKKLLLLVPLFTCMQYQLWAQPRISKKINTAETTYRNMVYNTLMAAFPHSYRNWTVSGFTRLLNDHQPYSIGLKYTCEMPENESKALMAAAYNKISDPNSTDQVAKALKSAAKCKLDITVQVNVPGQTANNLSYCKANTPIAMPVPVHTQLSLLGLHSANCALVDKGKANMEGDYYDNAIIILGKPGIRKKTEQQANGIISDSYYAGNDKIPTDQTVTRNIVVSMEGDSADISAVTKLIEWPKLKSLLSN